MSPAADPPPLRLKRGEDRRLRAGHPWIFSNEVDNAATPLASLPEGGLVSVEDSRGKPLGWGYVNPHALICARLMGRGAPPADLRGLIAERLRVARALRARMGRDRWGRQVFGESDGLPGLVVDRFDDVLVAQSATRGMDALLPEVEAALLAEFAPRALLWRNDGGARDLEGLPHELRWVGGPVEELSIQELPGLEFRVPVGAAQKTGWFYDQADNRAAVARYLPPRARVLDVCSYAGGWALSLLAQGAGEATCVDASATALEAAGANAARQGRTLTLRRGDAFETLQAMEAEGLRFDVVVVDPPAFIKRKRDLARGEAAYRKLNQLAMRLLADDALLVSCSCSWHLPAAALPDQLQAAARHLGRHVQILEFRGQAADHPVHPAVPESRYLKAVFARVTRLPDRPPLG